MKRGIIFLLCFIQLIYISTAFAQSTQITNGLNYLSSTQNPDGSWSGTVIRGMFPTTVASIETLSLLGQGNTAGYSNAVTWLQSHNLETTDYLAERIHALSTPGTDLSLLLLYLDEVYTAAWGGYKDCEVNNIDTALAVLALNKINYSALDNISYALGYLTRSQNADGGFGFHFSSCAGCVGDESDVSTTALVLIVLSQFKSTYDLQTEINNAATYLLAHQNPNGSFGEGTVYETALAFEALIESGAVSAENYAVLQNAIVYLTSTQLPNGSWNDDPYSTALALREITEKETTKR